MIEPIPSEEMLTASGGPHRYAQIHNLAHATGYATHRFDEPQIQAMTEEEERNMVMNHAHKASQLFLDAVVQATDGAAKNGGGEMRYLRITVITEVIATKDET